MKREVRLEITSTEEKLISEIRDHMASIHHVGVSETEAIHHAIIIANDSLRAKEEITYFAIIHWDGFEDCWSVHRKEKDGRVFNLGIVGRAQFPTHEEACDLFRSQDRARMMDGGYGCRQRNHLT